MEKNEKTKVCPVFEPTYKSIMKLPNDAMKLRMFIALCKYAFEEIEPSFGESNEERLLSALWEQLRIVFIQAKKRAKTNSINGAKGGRPRKANETDGFPEQNLNKPTDTNTITYTSDEGTAAANFNLIKQWICEGLDIKSCESFSEDFIPNLIHFFKKININSDEIKDYIQYVANYSREHSQNDLNGYFYKVIQSEDMFNDFISKNQEIS